MKNPSEMTHEEAEQEFRSLDDFFIHCKQSGQGISTKDAIRFRLCADRLHELGHGYDHVSEYHAADATMVTLIWAESIAACKRFAQTQTV